MSLHCPQCHAGRAALEPIVEHLAVGIIQQTVRCMLCGWRKSRNLLGPVIRPQPAAAPRPVKPKASNPNHKNGIKYAPCAVAKCPGRYVPARLRGGWPLCKVHRQTMWAWAKVPRSTPAPLVEIAPGWWDVNPERGHRAKGDAQ